MAVASTDPGSGPGPQSADSTGGDVPRAAGVGSRLPLMGARYLRPQTLVGIGVFLVALGMYLRTMAPTVSFWDCGEFIACSYILGVPHPPGAPLYVLLGRLFSLLPFHEVAWRVTLMSAVSSALGVWCVYLCGVALARRSLGGHSLRPFGDGRDVGVIAGAAVAALSLAFSYTYWFNAIEAEVYGYSILFTCLGLWVILYWEGTPHGAGNDRWLLLLAYLFGLGGGIHLLCLLTVPSLLLLAWFADAKLRRLIVLVLLLGGWGLLWLKALGPGSGSNSAIGLGLAGMLYYLYRDDRRSFWLVLGVVVLFVLGYSTYGALYVRSGLNPAIDENDPETLSAFIKFLNREQYGTESQLLGMLQGRAPRAFQFWHLQMKYFFQQFPLSWLEVVAPFRRATEGAMESVSISLVPYLLGLFGAAWHALRDWKRFAAVLLLFVVMGFGLSLYLNMPDPQPRERHYVFGGMFFAFALWMGLAWTGLVEAAREALRGRWRGVLVGLSLVGLLVPAGIGARLFDERDRQGDHAAYDYAYNILQSCDPNSLLFTNGDNDTFPLWFLQEVEGIRRDVRVINLSLLNTGWYIKQLRDREPRVEIRYSDEYIDSVLTDTEDADLWQRYWEEPQQVSAAGLEWELAAPPGYNVLRVQDVMMVKIIDWNDWQRPVHIAITVPVENQVGLEPFLQLTGMTYRVASERDPGVDREGLERNLRQVFRFRGINDPTVYRDENTTRLLINYRASLVHLADIYKRDGEGEKLVELVEWAEGHLFFSWDTYYLVGERLYNAGYLALGARFLEQAGWSLLQTGAARDDGDYVNAVGVADKLLEKYRDAKRAERLYRGMIELRPERPEAYFGLVVSRRNSGDAPGALQLLESYTERFGSNADLARVYEILQRDVLRQSDVQGQADPELQAEPPPTGTEKP